VLLPLGATVCPKCGRKGQPKTGNFIFDFLSAILPWFEEQLGPVAGTIAAGFFFVLFFVLLGLLFWVKFMPAGR
jgi:hypothetical protein